MRPSRFPALRYSLSAFVATALVTIIASTFALGQSESVVYRFKAGNDGKYPNATLLADKAGNLYGTTVYGGGSSNCFSGCGTVFELTPSLSGGHWTETVLYAFTGKSDGGQPWGGLAFDQAGNLYGTTTIGGSVGYGTVFQLTPPASGGAWILNVLHNLAGFNNGYPIYPVVDKFGDVYIEESGGGSSGLGSVSQMIPPATQGGAWIYKQLYAFKGQPDGYLPIGTLTFDKAGNLYGVTANGGPESGYGNGTVFELVRPATRNGTWTENVLYAFQNNPDGHNPYSGVIFDSAGNLYGTTVTPTVFELSPPSVSGGSWTEATLHDFGSGNDGAGYAFAGLTFRLPGTVTLYGATTAGGGVANNGVIFGVVP